MASMLAPRFTGWPLDWPSPYYCTPTTPPRPYGWQCTVWAAWRYHQLTGRYVPFGWGNALTWAQGAARTPGWSVSLKPRVPSIICLQPGVDGAYADGHVGIVEQINADGSVLTSNMNWGVPDGSSSQVEMVTHRPQTGISFIYLVGTGVTSPSSSQQNIAMLNNLVADVLGKLGVPQPAIALMNESSSGSGVSPLTLIGVVSIGGLLSVAGIALAGMAGI